MKKFQYFDLVKQAWRWSWSNRLLWLFGFFATGGLMSFDYKANDLEKLKIISSGAIFDNLGDKLSSGYVLSTILGVGAVFLLLIILSFIARAALIKGFLNLRANSKNKFKELFLSGWTRLRRLVLLEIILVAVNLVLAVLAVIVLAINQSAWTIVYILIGVLVIYNLFVFLFKHYAYCYVVLQEKGAWDSVKLSVKLLKNNFWKLLLAKILELGLWIATGFGVILTIVVLALPFILLGLISMFAFGQAGAVVVVVVGALFLIGVVLVLRGLISAFIQGYLTLIYWQFEK